MGRRELMTSMQLDRLRVVTGSGSLACNWSGSATRWRSPPGWPHRRSRFAGGGAAAEEFAAKHGRIAGSELVVLGLDRLGGGVLTHASDLDIVCSPAR